MILTVLKICGILIACILGIVLLIIFLLLFVPFRYDAYISFCGKKVKADAKVIWDLRIIRISYLRNEDGTQDEGVFLFGKKLLIADTESGGLEIPFEKIKNWLVGNYRGIMNDPDGPIECLDRIKQELQQPKWNIAVKKGFYRLKQIFHEIFPKSGNGEIVYGLDDPYLTGKVLEILAVLYPFYTEVFKVCPDFEQNVFYGELELKGKFRIRKLAYHIIVLIMHKKARMLYHKLMRLTHYE